jgi:hypothetical protein
VNGLRLKLFSFSVRGELVEPQKNTFARAPLEIKFLLKYIIRQGEKQAGNQGLIAAPRMFNARRAKS